LFETMRLSKIPDFRYILRALEEKLPYADVKVRRFIQACIRYDAPTPEVAQTLAELFDPADMAQDQIAKDALKAIGEKMFNANGVDDLFQMATGHLQMVYIDDLYLDTRQYDADWEIEVTTSIRRIGLLDPIFALIVSEDITKLRVWDGVLRVQACHLLGHKRIPAYVFPKDAKLTRTLQEPR
jgi:hypothetical protein